ncbi:hypothetical protein CARN8_530002 [mine drainage metagenome]|uniref:Uncharacterized protein n=1 Tax=mine drainage metagenome TaxID=410659 RepID=A0A3P3ZQN0_9ZZZZ
MEQCWIRLMARCYPQMFLSQRLWPYWASDWQECCLPGGSSDYQSIIRVTEGTGRLSNRRADEVRMEGVDYAPIGKYAHPFELHRFERHSNLPPNGGIARKTRQI